MHRLVISALCLIGAWVHASETAPPRTPLPAGVDIVRALALTAAWEGAQPERARRQLRVVYWTPADREPAPQYRERLTRVMHFTQEFYATQMASYGLGRRSVNLELEPDGLLKLRVVRGANPAASYRTESGQEIRRDCVALLKAEGLDADDETMVIFCNLATWDAEKRTMRQDSPYYASGTHRNGTAWQVDSPLLDPDLLPEKTAMLSDGQYGHIPVGRYNSIFVGGVVHELGHALGLPHCAESPDELATRGHALMGSGNRTMGEELRGEGPGTFLSLPHALKLLTHVQFSGSVKGMKEPAQVTWRDFAVRSGEHGALVVSGAVQGRIPVYAVLAYADPSGGGDYDSQVGVAVPDEQGAFSVVVQAPSTSKATSGELRLVACCVNGAATAYAGSDGKPTFPFGLLGGNFDLTPTRIQIELAAALPLARAGTLSPQARQDLHPRAQEVLRRLLAADNATAKAEPAEVAATITTMPLSDCRPLSAVTGWGGVHYDRLPPQEPLISGGQLFVHGLFAHVDAKHVYRLGGTWARLHGHAGIGGGGYGPVEFTIRGDGKELWRSGVVKPGPPREFSLALTGVKELELLTSATPAGAGGAWGVWLEPVLERD